MRWIARIFFEPEESKRHSKQGPRRLAADRRRIPLIFPSHDAYPTVRPDIISPLMTAPLLTPEQIAEVSLLVAKYITTQRERYAPRAAPLSAQQKATLGGFFSPELVDSTRLLVLRGERVSNPDFYPMLRTMGFNNLPDQATMGAITFEDVVVSHGPPFSEGLLFHELVHVEQYRQLGTPRFAECYVRGFLSGGGYDGIPLERNAYELAGRFEGNPTHRFSVEDEVATWIREARF